MTTSRRNTIMLWMAYTEFFYPGCELQPGYFYLSIPELYYIPEDGACIGAVGVDAYEPPRTSGHDGQKLGRGKTNAPTQHEAMQTHEIECLYNCCYILISE